MSEEQAQQKQNSYQLKASTNLSPAKIKIEEHRGRKDFTGLDKLVESIKEHGLIQPLVVDDAQDENGCHRLLAGERRYRSMMILAWAEIPVVFKSDLDDVVAKEIELEENVRRKDLSWLEEVELMRQIDELKREKHGSSGRGTKGGWKESDTADLVGVDKSTVNRQIQVAKKLQDNPDLRREVENLPFNAARKRIDQLEEREKNSRLVESGKIELSQDLRLGDARDLIKELESESVHLLLTDPPFGSSKIESSRGKHSTTNTYRQTLGDSDNMNMLDLEELLSELYPELDRVLVEGAHFYIFCDSDSFCLHSRLIEQTKNLEIEAPPLIWYKGRATSTFTGYSYQPCYEMILFGYKAPRSRRLDKASTALFDAAKSSEFTVPKQKEKTHPFQKPQGLLRFLINQSTSPGEKILDPFAGSGSTLVAAWSLSRSPIGFEFSQTNYQDAQNFLKKEVQE